MLTSLLNATKRVRRKLVVSAGPGKVNFNSMTKTILRMIFGLALALSIVVISGCAESTREKASGKGAVRGINAIVDAPQLQFLIEERNLGIIGFKAATGLAPYDDLSYNFNFDLLLPERSEADRVATEFIDVTADTDYTVILTGSIDNPSIIRWEDPDREWVGDETVLEVIFTHLSPALGEVDVYFAAPGTAPVLGGAVGSLTDGQRLPITEYEAGDYEIILTAPADPSTVLYTSNVLAPIAQNRTVFAIFDPDPTITGPISVSLIGEGGVSANIADPNYPAQLRLLHAAFGTGNVDGYYNLDFNNLIYPNVGHQEISAYADIDNGTTSLNLTAAGNSGAEILTGDVITLPGTKRSYVLAGEPGNVFFNSLTEDARPLSTSPVIRVANFAVNYAFVDVYITDPGTDINDVLPRFVGLPTQLDTTFVPVIDGMRELTVTEFLMKDPIATPITIDLSNGDVVSIGIFDTVDPLLLDAFVYDVQ